MSELSDEEKKAIDILINEIADVVVGEYCTHCKICENEDTECYYTKAIDTVYKLILKQQKEIEELKEKNEKIETINYRVNKNLLETAEELEKYKRKHSLIKCHYISKDKIKAKIEELDIEIQCCEYADDDTEVYKQDIEKEKRRLLRDKLVLQSLLEED